MKKCSRCLHWFASCMCAIYGEVTPGDCSDFEPRGGCANCDKQATIERVRELADKLNAKAVRLDKVSVGDLKAAHACAQTLIEVALLIENALEGK